MFGKRSKASAVAVGRYGNTQQAMFETLEGRQLLSAAPSVVKPAVAILGPSAVEGKYKGNVTESSGGTVAVKVVVTGTEAELIIGGSTKLTESITAAHLKAIREGTFDVTFKLSGASVTFTGKESKAGAKISGSYKTSTSKTGTFALTKYA